MSEANPGLWARLQAARTFTTPDIDMGEPRMARITSIEFMKSNE